MAKNDAYIKLEYTLKDDGEGVHVSGGMTDVGFAELVEGANLLPKEVLPQLVIKIMMKKVENRIKALTPDKINSLMNYLQENPDAIFDTSVLPIVEEEFGDKSVLSVEVSRNNAEDKVKFATEIRLQKLQENPCDLGDIIQAVTSFELVTYNDEIRRRTDEEWLQKFEECGKAAAEKYQQMLAKQKVH